MEFRKDNKKIYVSLSYREGVEVKEKLKNNCGAKWEAKNKEWVIDEEFEKIASDILLSKLGRGFKSDKKIKVEYEAQAFYNKKSFEIEMGNLLIARRESRDYPVKLFNNTMIIKGGFTKSGGSNGYPAATFEEGTILRSEIYEDFYEMFEEKDKLRIVGDVEKTIDELLEREKELIAELEEVRKKIKERETARS